MSLPTLASQPTASARHHVPRLRRAAAAATAAGLTLAAAATLAAPGSLVGPTTAEAAVTGYRTTTSYVGGGTSVNVRSAPVVTAGNPDNTVYRLGVNAGLTIDCQLVGGKLGFSQYAENRTWNKLSDGRYIHDVVTTTPGGARTNLADGGYVAWSSTIPRCGGAPATTRETRAVDFARSQLGSNSTTLTPDRMWSGWCELFVEQAYGTSGRYGSAIAHYNARRGEIRTDANPPAGALVFYSWGSYGHVGISLGGGQVISTQGDGVTTFGPVRQHGVTAIGLPYLGWAPAPGGWPGR